MEEYKADPAPEPVVDLITSTEDSSDDSDVLSDEDEVGDYEGEAGDYEGEAGDEDEEEVVAWECPASWRAYHYATMPGTFTMGGFVPEEEDAEALTYMMFKDLGVFHFPIGVLASPPLDPVAAFYQASDLVDLRVILACGLGTVALVDYDLIQVPAKEDEDTVAGPEVGVWEPVLDMPFSVALTVYLRLAGTYTPLVRCLALGDEASGEKEVHEMFEEGAGGVVMHPGTQVAYLRNMTGAGATLLRVRFTSTMKNPGLAGDTIAATTAFLNPK